MPELIRKTDPESPPKIWVAGHRGLVGSAFCRRLGAALCTVLGVPRDNLEADPQASVEGWLDEYRPEQKMARCTRDVDCPTRQGYRKRHDPDF